jgi:hypothetical protein
VVSHCAHDLLQEQSKGVIELEDDEPDAIDELLKYLYTLSDLIKVPNRSDYYFVEEELLEDLPDGLQVLSKEFKHLADILVVADKYCVRDLATLAGEKISTRLSILQSLAHCNFSLEAAELVWIFPDALYFEQDIQPLQEYQDALLKIIVEEVNICMAIARVDVKLTRTQPKLVCELLRQSAKAIESKQQKVMDVLAELPLKKRRKFK